MISGKYAESTRIKWERSVDAKLSTEVGDWMVGTYRDGFMLPTRLHRHVRLKTFIDAGEAFQVNRIRRSFSKAVGRRLSQKLSWVVFALLPDFRIELAKNTRAIGGPAPPVIPGQPFQRNQ